MTEPVIDARACVWPLVQQMNAAKASGLYFAALILGLTLPDMLGALGSANGRSSGAKYRDWLRDNVPQTNTGQMADQIYQLRCSLLHQGSTQSEKTGERLAFVEPNPPNPELYGIVTMGGDAEAVMWISVPLYLADLSLAIDRWLWQFGETGVVQRNLRRFARRRPEGLHMVQAPVIA